MGLNITIIMHIMRALICFCLALFLLSSCGEKPKEIIGSQEKQIAPVPIANSEITLLIENLLQKQSYDENLYKLNHYNKALTKSEKEYMLFFVQGEKPKNMGDSQFAEMVNDVLNLCHRDGTIANTLIPVLFAMAEDSKRAMIYRDYAVQHLANTYVACGASNAKKIEKFLESLSREVASELAGTALYSYARIVVPEEGLLEIQKSLHIPKGKQSLIEELCIQALRNEQSHPYTHMTALNLLHRWKHEQTLEIARNILKQETGLQSNVQRTCIGVIGAEGNLDEDLARLESIVPDTTSMQRTLNYAISQLHKR